MAEWRGVACEGAGKSLLRAGAPEGVARRAFRLRVPAMQARSFAHVTGGRVSCSAKYSFYPTAFGLGLI